MIFLVGDLHISQSKFSKKNWNFYRDVLYSLSRLTKKASELKPTHVFLLGDVFDKPRISGDEKWWYDLFISRLLDTGTEIWGLQGNHDFNRGRHPLFERNGVNRMIPEQVISTSEGTVSGSDYTINPDDKDYEHSLDNIVKRCETDIFLGHATVSGMDDLAKLSMEAVDASAVKRVVCGHVHQFRTYKTAKDKPVSSIGCLRPVRQQDMTSDFGYAVLEEGELRFESTAVREFIDLTQSNPSQVEEALECASDNPPMRNVYILNTEHYLDFADKYPLVLESTKRKHACESSSLENDDLLSDLLGFEDVADIESKEAVLRRLAEDEAVFDMLQKILPYEDREQVKDILENIIKDKNKKEQNAEDRLQS